MICPSLATGEGLMLDFIAVFLPSKLGKIYRSFLLSPCTHGLVLKIKWTRILSQVLKSRGAVCLSPLSSLIQSRIKPPSAPTGYSPCPVPSPKLCPSYVCKSVGWHGPKLQVRANSWGEWVVTPETQQEPGWCSCAGNCGAAQWMQPIKCCVNNTIVPMTQSLLTPMISQSPGNIQGVDMIFQS